MGKLDFLTNKVNGANEFNKLYRLYVDYEQLQHAPKSDNMHDSIYKYLIILLCTLLETNTEECTTKWYDNNKSKIKISSFKAKDSVVHDLLTNLVNKFNSNDYKPSNLVLFSEFIDKLYLISHKDSFFIEKLNLDFKITFGKDHGVNEFINILKKIGIDAEIFKKKVLIYNDDKIIDNTEEIEIASVFNLLILERNSIIHENKIRGEVPKKYLLNVAILSINLYFDELFIAIGNII